MVCYYGYRGYDDYITDCDDIDGVLQRLEGHSGVDRALLQAKLWAKYVKEIITYVEKKNALGKCCN